MDFRNCLPSLRRVVSIPGWIWNAKEHQDLWAGILGQKLDHNNDCTGNLDPTKYCADLGWNWIYCIICRLCIASMDATDPVNSAQIRALFQMYATIRRWIPRDQLIQRLLNLKLFRNRKRYGAVNLPSIGLMRFTFANFLLTKLGFY